MKISKILIPLLVCSSFITPVIAADKTQNTTQQNQQQVQQQIVEVVFVLDTTGSMGGLLEGAKSKIWYIANEIQNAKTNVEVRIGLIAYRDRGDDYITKHFPITSDIHSIYAELIEFQAGGGGDAPESVNQALYEAVQQQNWSDAHDTLRIVFLVGDAPPKMNYQDDVKYMQTVKLAKQKDIIINTILAGNSQQTKTVWQEIAQNANGSFSQIAQDGNVTIVKTPFDNEIQHLNIELNTTVILYGSAAVKKQASKVMESIALAKPAASSDMASYNSKRKIKSRVFAGDGDLLQELELKNEVLGALSDDKLPANMQKMDDKQRRLYIENMQQKRSEIQTKIDKLAKQRSVYMAEQIKTLSAKDKNSFDENMVSIIREQASEKGIKY
uniref:VWFA domain-containing protein n=1 Tax=OCS116 cluster bacterium TaxID=2030921 RepID=A0A2A4YV97_9PROT